MPKEAPPLMQPAVEVTRTDAVAGVAPVVPALSVVVPTRDEAGNVAELVARLERVLPGERLEVIFVDDSDDDTPAEIEACRRRSPLTIKLLHRNPSDRADGLGGAVVAGLRVAEAPWACVMDADLQHPPEVVAALLARARETGDDVVVATRFCGEGSVGDFGPVRRGLSRASSTAAGLMFRRELRGVTDPLSGFFLVRRAALNLDALRPHGFKILLEILVRTRGARVSEVPFTFAERYAGESKASPREAVRYLRLLWRLRFRAFAERAGRFGLVGTTGLAVNTALLAALVEVAHLNYVLGAALATQGSTLWNFSLTERWVFRGRSRRRGPAQRLGLFLAVNNAALAIRAPLLVALTAGVGLHYLASNALALAALFALRFMLADTWIWAGREEPATATHNYDIHGLVTVCSDGPLPELERFRVGVEFADPTIRVELGRVPRAPSDAAVRYSELGPFGFAARIESGDRVRVTATPMLRLSPHVLYTNVVEPILRWTFVRHGYALVHGACLAVGDQAILLTARTDTGKTTTLLKTLDRHQHSFLSDDLTLVAPDGRVLTYPKPLTISRHTLHAVRTPLLSWPERAGLIVQSRLHSRSGRRFALLLARTHLPAATINALIQFLVPPPKYHVDRLVPGVAVAPQARLAGLVVIERGGTGEAQLTPDVALETLMRNCEDAYGFPPYAAIEAFLHSRDGDDLRAAEREIVARALGGLPATVMRSETMDWCERLPPLLAAACRAAAAAPVPQASPARVAT